MIIELTQGSQGNHAEPGGEWLLALTNGLYLFYLMMTASEKVHLPFDRPFDKLTVLSKVEGLTVLSETEGLRCVASGSFFFAV
jgi:hypothetical protein